MSTAHDDGDDFYAAIAKQDRDPDHDREVFADLSDPEALERAHRYVRKVLISESENVAVAEEGTRNDTLNRSAFKVGRFVGGGVLDRDAAWNELFNAGRLCGLPDAEIHKTLVSGLTGGMANPKGIPEQSAPAVTVVETAPDLTTSQDAEFWRSRAVLAHLHIFARARRVSPWAVLGVTLARVVTATPFTVCLPPIVGTRASLNCFIGLVGPSGSGKGAAEGVARDAIDLPRPITTIKTGSGEGIAHAYRHREKGVVVWNDFEHAVMFSVPEIDAMAAVTARKGATLMPELRSAWSGELLGFGYADPTKRLPVPAHEYRLCMVAGIQPMRAECLLDDSDGGTPQRFLWMPATDPEAPDVVPTEPRPMPWSPPTMDAIVSVGGNYIKVCDSARDTITTARTARLRGTADEALDGHALLCRLKTAAALGLLEGRYEVTEDDWRLAGIVQAKSDAVRSRIAASLVQRAHETNAARGEAEASRAIQVAEKVEASRFQRVCKGIQTRLAGGSMGRGKLKNSFTSVDRDAFVAAVEHLLQSGHIEEIDGPRGKHLAIRAEGS